MITAYRMKIAKTLDIFFFSTTLIKKHFFELCLNLETQFNHTLSVSLCFHVPLSLSLLVKHTHTQCGPQMAWWCQGERSLLGSKSFSVWPPPPFTCFLLLFLFLFVILFLPFLRFQSRFLSPSPSSLYLSLSPLVSLHFSPLICPSEVLINYSCLCPQSLVTSPALASSSACLRSFFLLLCSHLLFLSAPPLPSPSLYSCRRLDYTRSTIRNGVS